MATTRKRASQPAPTPEQAVSIDSLAAFMEIEQPDRERLGLALELAKEAALAVTGKPVGDVACHGVRHGVHMLASQLLLKNQLDASSSGAEIPGVVRYLWKTAV
jgi:hypothetical protein